MRWESFRDSVSDSRHRAANRSPPWRATFGPTDTLASERPFLLYALPERQIPTPRLFRQLALRCDPVTIEDLPDLSLPAKRAWMRSGLLKERNACFQNTMTDDAVVRVNPDMHKHFHLRAASLPGAWPIRDRSSAASPRLGGAKIDRSPNAAHRGAALPRVLGRDDAVSLATESSQDDRAYLLLVLDEQDRFCPTKRYRRGRRP